MAEARSLAAHVTGLDFATKLPKDDDDIGKGLRVTIKLVVPLMTPAEIEELAYMQSEGRTKLTLLQEQLPMFGKGGDSA